MIRPQRNLRRDMIDLGGVWRIRFDPDDAGERQGWLHGLPDGMAIAMPGSWNEQLAEAGYMNYLGAAWYETAFTVPLWAKGRRLALRFGGADYQAQVFINGAPAGRSGPAHLPFEIPLLDVEAGETVRLTVRVDNRLPADSPTPPVSKADYQAERRLKDEYFPAVRFDFFPYGGLSRPVYLLVLPPAGLDAVWVDTAIDGADGLVRLRLQGRFDAIARLAATLETPDGVRYAAEAHPEGDAAAIRLRIPGCPLWSPAAPVLLPLRIEAFDAADEPVDQVDLRIGVREVRVAGAQLLLNGAPIVLKGFGKHEDSPMRGRGLDLPMLVKDFQLLRWTGANSVRTSHYPYAEEFYDFCDEAGILVIDEVFSVNLDFRKTTPATLEAHKDAVTALITRDYNRPCVIAWSLANEPGYLAEPDYTEKSAPYWQALFAHARALDPARPLTHANVHYAGLDDPAFAQADILTINRYYGWYTEPAQLQEAVARLTTDFNTLAAMGKPIFVAEFGADALAGQHATTPQLFTEEYQADFIEAYWRAIMAHPAVIGGHVWNFADFRTAQHGRRVVFNLKGVFTRDRTPKLAAHRLRALWG